MVSISPFISKASSPFTYPSAIVLSAPITIGIVVTIDKAVVKMVLIFSLIPNCSNPSVIVPSVPIIIGITVTRMFHSFFNSLEKIKYLSVFYTFLKFCRPLKP